MSLLSSDSPGVPLWQPARRDPGPSSQRAALDVVGLGEISVDQVCEVEAFPGPGEELAVAGYHLQPGGQVATALLACAQLGLRTALLARVGDDSAAAVATSPLRKAGVELLGVRTVRETPTRTAVILVERESGERTVLGHRDPRLAFEPAAGDADLIRQARVLLVDARDPDAAEWAARIAREAGIPVVLDAHRPWQGVESLLGVVDFPIVGRRFAEELGSTGSVRDGLRALAAFGARLAVVTLGEFGAIAGSTEGSFDSPAFAVEVRDTTGAGDAFHAGFVWSLLQGLGAERAVRVATAVAAMNCEALGAQGGLPTQTELERFLASREPRTWREPVS